jgi:hypothetical protein
MSFLDALLGRTRPVQPNLDVLFAIPAASFSLQAALDIAPTGAGAVCFTPAEGAGARQSETEILDLLYLETDIAAEMTTDEFGFTWITCRQRIPDLAALVTALHAINTTLSDNGFGSGLLCTVIGFAANGTPSRRLALVYLFKRGTVYPFAPTLGHHRDNALELQSLTALAGEVPTEPDLERWFPLWDAPVP